MTEQQMSSTYEAIEVRDDDEQDTEMALHPQPTSQTSPTNATPQHRRQQPSRLVSLDVFRGFTVALMILVEYAGGIFPAINHSPWNGLTLADLVMPFFLFIVGVSLALAYKKPLNKAVATRKAILRGLKLLVLGLFLQGGFLHGINDLTYGVDIERLRYMGVLQRIAIGYLIGAACEIWLKDEDNNQNGAVSGPSLLRKYRFQLAVALVLITMYLSLLYGLYVPDWEYHIQSEKSAVNCGVRGDTGPACNAVGMIDRAVLGIQYLYTKPIYRRTKQCSLNSPDNGPLPPGAPSWCRTPFEPEGLLSTVMAVVTCLMGLQYGHVIVHYKDHRERVRRWLVPSAGLLVVGVGLDLLGMHINKVLYTVSYTGVTSGAAGFLLAGIYWVVDVGGRRRMSRVLEWMGVHSLVIYMVVACNLVPIFLQGFYLGQPQNNVLRLIGIGR